MSCFTMRIKIWPITDRRASSAILALKLSETTYLKEHVGELPVLLLDDVLSELDEERQQELLRWTADRQLQLIMTSAYRPNRLPESVDMRCLEKSHGA